MADRPDDENAVEHGSSHDLDPTHESTLGTPRWVIGFMVVAAVLVLLFVGLHRAGGGLGSHVRP